MENFLTLVRILFTIKGGNVHNPILLLNLPRELTWGDGWDMGLLSLALLFFDWLSDLLLHSFVEEIQWPELRINLGGSILRNKCLLIFQIETKKFRQNYDTISVFKVPRISSLDLKAFRVKKWPPLPAKIKVKLPVVISITLDMSPIVYHHESQQDFVSW